MSRAATLRRAWVATLVLGLAWPVAAQEAAPTSEAAASEPMATSEGSATPHERVEAPREPVAPSATTAPDGALDSPFAPPPAPVDPLEGRRYPVVMGQRPLTLPEGEGRLDQATVVRTSSAGFVGNLHTQVSLGLTNEVELAVAWPVTRDPTLILTAMVLHSDVVDVGVRGSVTVPAVTTGNTLARLGVPVVLRLGIVRVTTGVELELLFESQVSPLVSVPLTAQLQAGRRFAVGAQGWGANLDGRFWLAQAGLFVAHTFVATPASPIAEARVTTSYSFDERAIIAAITMSFFPRLW